MHRRASTAATTARHAAVSLATPDGAVAQGAQLFQCTAELRQIQFERLLLQRLQMLQMRLPGCGRGIQASQGTRSEEHTSELQSLMRISYAVFCLKKKKNKIAIINY